MPNNTSPRTKPNQATSPKFRLSAHNISPTYAIGVLLFAGLLALIVWWFFSNFERVSHTDYQLRAQAQYNPYYAAELLINNQHGAKNSQNTVAMTLLDSDLKTLLDDLPPLNQGKNAAQPTLIINSIGSKLTDARFEQLRSWVEQGGHVITFTADVNSYESMQAVLARLKALQSEQNDAVAEDIVNDSELAELIGELNTGNQFLTQLGIFAVAPESDSSDSDDMAEISEQLEDLLAEMPLEEQDKSQTDAEFIKNTLTRLAEEQPLALLPMGHSLSSDALSSPVVQNAIAPAEPSLLVQSSHNGQQLNTDLLQVQYPDTAKIHFHNPQHKGLQTTKANNKKVLSAQAASIRRYLTEQQRLLQQSTATKPLPADKSKVTATSSTAKATATETRRLSKLLTAILALSDEQLLALFKPIDDIYLDIGFGKGRISVLVDSNSFANPNPNLDLPKDASNSCEDDRTRLDTPLANWLHPDFYVTLLSADNAAWLIDLTEDSSPVWILPNVDIDPLPVMLWQQARPAVLGLALLALLWLWSLFNRFGKMAHLPDDQSHDILRYFRQVGRYGWQQDKAAQLLEVTRAQVRQQLAKLTATSEGTRTGMADDALTVQQSYATDMAALNQVLTAQLEQKKQRYTQQTPRPVSEHNGIKASLPNNELANLLTNLLTNETFIKAQITPERLRAALLPTAKQGNTAFELTQMTQTLWTVQWLLK
jgi:hypothetical protein